MSIKKNTMEVVEVYSPIEDRNIHISLQYSGIWKEAYHLDELVDVKSTNLYQYSFKFNGLKPIQILKMKKVR